MLKNLLKAPAPSVLAASYMDGESPDSPEKRIKARVDGANLPTTMYRILIPMNRSAILVAFLLSWMHHKKQNQRK